MSRGKVEWFDDIKGYGFIVTEGGGRVFVHYTAIEGEGFRNLKKDQKVEFDIVESRRGKEAANVKTSASSG